MIDGIDRPKVQYFVSWPTSHSSNIMNSAVRAVAITRVLLATGLCISFVPLGKYVQTMARNNIYWCVANFSHGNVERIMSADPIWTKWICMDHSLNNIKRNFSSNLFCYSYSCTCVQYAKKYSLLLYFRPQINEKKSLKVCNNLPSFSSFTVVTLWWNNF